MKRAKKTPIPSKAVIPERAERLYKLVQLLGTGPKTRKAILQRLKIDIRTFYRDLELLRDCEIAVDLDKSRYGLTETASKVTPRLPFPDPNLTLGEAMILAKGRNPVHQKLKRILQQIVG